MFKQYECGCIGFVTNAMTMEPGAKRVTCFKACDSDGVRELSIHRHDKLQEKPGTKLTDAEIEALFAELASLVSDGHALRELRIAMRVAGVSP